MIIDAHVHLDLAQFKNVKKAARDLIDGLDKANIGKAIVMPDNYLNINPYTEQACNLYPKRLFGFGMVNPKQSKSKIKTDINKLAAKKWCKGIKIHPRTQEFTLDHPGVFHILDYLAYHELPITIDCLPIFKFVNLDERNFPNAFDKLAKSNPSTNIIIAHMGGHRLMDAFGVARGNPNIFLEVSYTFHFYRGSSIEDNMAFAIKNIDSERVIYGSDHPSIGIKDGIKVFDRFCDKYKIDPSIKNDIVGKNIARLIGLEKEGTGITESDKQEIIELYESRLKKHGMSVKTMGWRDKKQQYLRFRLISEIGAINNRSVLDVGCGFGDLYDYLRKNRLKVEYTGYDLAPGIIATAKKTRPKEVTLEVKDILKDTVRKKYDYVVASGILNKRISDNFAYAKKMVSTMFKLSKRGIAINMFTTDVTYKEPHLYYYSTENLLKFAKSLSNFVVVKRNYPLYDSTLYIYKAKSDHAKKELAERTELP